LSPASATHIAQQVRAGSLDPVDVTEAAIVRLTERDPSLHAYLDSDIEFARSCAQAVSDRLARDEDPGLLAGVPISLKDNLAVNGRTLTAGSAMLAGYRAPYTSTVAERLLAQGAVLLGRTNLDEFGMGASTEYSAFGPSHNPWDVSRVPGGSSGGSAAAVAAGIVPVALGSETGGSVRQPASLCGVTGFKPGYGAVSRFGLVAFGSSLDQIGPITAHAEDASLVYDVIAGHDPRDATSLPGSRVSARSTSASLEGLKIGIPEEFLDDAVDERVLEQISASLDVLDSAGAFTKVLKRGQLASVQHAIAAYYLVAASEASSNLARFDGMHYGPRCGGENLADTYAATRAALFGPEVKRRIMLGSFALSAGYSQAWYQKAQSVRRLILAEYTALFEEYDLIAGPTSPVGAFELGERSDDPCSMYLCDLLTAPACLAGLPSISVPCGLARRGPYKGLPVGLCLTGRPGDDHRVLAAGRAFEAARGVPERCAMYEADA
jgi:aspartyl-tRNA(Asn)/glutamyl-tRNA(Gln) amidotransferase subunit A